MTTAQCRRILQEAFGHSPHSYRKGRAILHSIFAYGFRQELCDSNPVARIEPPAVEEKRIEPLSREEVECLCKTVQKHRFRDMRFSPGGGRVVPLRALPGCGGRIAESPATGRAVGRRCAWRQGSRIGSRMCAVTLLPATTRCISEICRSCSWRGDSEMQLCCAADT